MRIALKTLEVTVARPNLVVEVQNLTVAPVPGEPIRFRVSLKNEGTVASIATTLHLYGPVTSKTDATTGYTFLPDFTDAPLKETVSIGPILANSSEIEEFLTFTAAGKIRDLSLQGMCGQYWW